MIHKFSGLMVLVNTMVKGPKTPSPFGGSAFARYAQKLANYCEEWQLGIQTRGTALSNKADAVYYATVSYAQTRQVLQRLHLDETDVFVDVGAGKGRVLCLAAQQRLLKVMGVECSGELARIARRNVERMWGKKTSVNVYAQPAEEFDYSAATVLYFFNPFEAN